MSLFWTELFIFRYLIIWTLDRSIKYQDWKL